METQSATTRKCFEDFEEGQVFQFKVPGPTAEEIKEFAARYDPQRFHLDEAEAARTHFGALVASGFHTLLLCFRPFCVEVLNHSHGVGAPGVDRIKWRRPWYPGEELDVRVTIAKKSLSSKRTDRGYLNVELRASAAGEPTLEMDWMVIMLTREGAGLAAT